MAKDTLKKDLDQKQILLVAGLFVALLAVVYFMFLRGGDEPTELGTPPTGTEVSPGAQPTPPVDTDGETDEEVEEPVETSRNFTRRDPFEPVVDLTGDESGPPGLGDTTTDPNGDTGTTDESPFGEDDPTIEPDPDPDPTPQAGQQRVRLIDVFRANGQRRAQIRVDDVVYIVNEGETFAENFNLVSTAGQCASILFGDDQFTLCEGEEVYK